MKHLDQEQIRSAATGADIPDAITAHARGCTHCAGRITELARLSAAAHAVDERHLGQVRAPDFAALLEPVLRHRDAVPLVAAPAPAGAAVWRLAGAVLSWQARLVPRSLWPLTLLGLIAVTAAALRAPQPALGAVLFGPGVALLVMLGALAVCDPRRDPRQEVLGALPVAPVTVWLARLSVVLGADLAAAATASVLASALGLALGPWALIGAWLGPALLASSVAVVGGVWRSPWLGTGLGGAAWLLGAGTVLGDLPRSLAEAGGPVWSTSPATLAASAALLALAGWLVSRPGRGWGGANRR